MSGAGRCQRRGSIRVSLDVGASTSARPPDVRARPSSRCRPAAGALSSIFVAMLRRVCKGSRTAAERVRRKVLESWLEGVRPKASSKLATRSPISCAFQCTNPAAFSVLIRFSPSGAGARHGLRRAELDTRSEPPVEELRGAVLPGRAVGDRPFRTTCVRHALSRTRRAVAEHVAVRDCGRFASAVHASGPGPELPRRRFRRLPARNHTWSIPPTSTLRNRPCRTTSSTSRAKDGFCRTSETNRHCWTLCDSIARE
jgi:hypothetical protein